MVAVSTAEGMWNAWQSKLAANPLLPLISPTGREDQSHASGSSAPAAVPPRADQSCEAKPARRAEAARQ